MDQNDIQNRDMIKDDNIELDKIIKRKEYMKQYREKNKEKIKNYESKKPSKVQTERVKKCITKNNEILKIIKNAYLNKTLIIQDEEEFNKLKLLIKK